jgi:hypothetical protein
MNQELIEMARQAGVRDDEHRFEFSEYKYLERFAALVAAAEREKVATHWEQLHGFDKHAVAAFIRARGESK